MDYTTLIPAEHRDKPFFVAVVALLCGAFVDIGAGAGALPGLYAIDTAAATQLDSVGAWVGFSRDQNVPSLGVVTLADGDYRILLRAKIAANHWDGGMESLQVILAQIFPGGSIVMFAVDNQDMSMDVYITGGTPTALQIALLKGGLLVPKPEGVRINFVLVTGPLFGLDRNDSAVAGLDVGAFVTYL